MRAHTGGRSWCWVLNFSAPYFCREDLSLNLVLVAWLDCLVPELSFRDPAVPIVYITLVLHMAATIFCFEASVGIPAQVLLLTQQAHYHCASSLVHTYFLLKMVPWNFSTRVGLILPLHEHFTFHSQNGVSESVFVWIMHMCMSKKVSYKQNC